MKNEDAPVRNKRKHDCVRSFKDETEYSEITSEFDREARFVKERTTQ